MRLPHAHTFPITDSFANPIAVTESIPIDDPTDRIAIPFSIAISNGAAKPLPVSAYTLSAKYLPECLGWLFCAPSSTGKPPTAGRLMSRL